jgi:hypothetical protein
MKNKWNARARGLACDTSASEIAEFAAVLPVLLMILIGIFWFGQAFRIYGTITHAAREGARAAVAPLCATCSGANSPPSNAWSAVQAAMNADNLNPTQLSQPTVLPALCPCGTSSTDCNGAPGLPSAVSCDGSQTNICVQGTNGSSPPPEVALSTSAAGGAGTCGISVSLQYPYTLGLPGVFSGRTTIYLQAQAQMRSETQ